MHFLNLNCNNTWLPWQAIYHLNMSIIVDSSDIAMPVNSWYSLLWCLLRCSVRLYLKLFIGGLMSYLRYLCFFAHSGVQHILCCVYVLFFFVLCTLCFQFLWIVHSFGSPLRYSLTFIYYIQFVQQWEEKGKVFVPHNNNKAKPCRVLNRQIC